MVRTPWAKKTKISLNVPWSTGRSTPAVGRRSGMLPFWHQGTISAESAVRVRYSRLQRAIAVPEYPWSKCIPRVQKVPTTQNIPPHFSKSGLHRFEEISTHQSSPTLGEWAHFSPWRGGNPSTTEDGSASNTGMVLLMKGQRRMAPATLRYEARRNQLVWKICRPLTGSHTLTQSPM